MYPPPGPFTIPNPHVYGEPAIAATGKRERTGTDIDRKEYRDTDSETRDRNERYAYVASYNWAERISRIFCINSVLFFLKVQ